MTRTGLLTGAALWALVAPGCSITDTCPSCEDPENSGKVENPELLEISGIAASFQFDDVIYAHNDSGDSSRFFALTAAGADLATFVVDGAQNDDWEDIARAPCASGDCIYIADIGDNELIRTSYTIYLVSEPTAIEPGVHTVPTEKATFTYSDGPTDAEVLLVHPRTGAVTIVSKAESGPASIFELGTLVPDGQLTAEKAGEFEPPKGSSKFTGGSIHPDATGILLRTKTRLFYYPMRPEQTAAEALEAEGCPLELAQETQGEAVTWLRNGDGIMTIGEGIQAPVNIANCGG
jgi:hypothetical protein